MRRLRLSALVAILCLLVFVSIASARAGGGGGYHGGGGGFHSSGGGGGFHSSGGGYHSSDGGGGGDVGSAFVFIIVVIFIILYVLAKAGEASQSSTIRRRYQMQSEVDRNAILARLRAADAGFDENVFYQRTTSAFLKIQQAWASQD